MFNPIKRLIRKVIWTAVFIIVFLAMIILPEIAYIQIVEPKSDERIITNFLERRGKFASIKKFYSNNEEYYYVKTTNEAPGLLFWLVIPSGPPGFVFDSSGKLVDWAKDTGENRAFHERWGHFSNAIPVTIEEIKALMKTGENK